MKTEWDLSLVIDGNLKERVEELRKISTKAVDEFVGKWKDDNSYLSNATKLREALDELDLLSRMESSNLSELYFYILATSLEQDNSEYKADYAKSHDITVNLENKLQFFEINLSKVSEEIRAAFLESSELQNYKHYLTKLFEKAKHILSDSEEKIISKFWKTADDNWERMISELLSKQERDVLGEDGKLTKKSFSEIIELTSNKNKKVRDEAAKMINEILEKYVEVAEHEFNSILETKKVIDEIRNYSTPQQSRFISDDVSPETIEALASVVSENFDIAKKFYEVKSKMLGVEKLQYHERNVPVGDFNNKMEFEAAYELVDRSFSALDKEFGEIYRQFFINGQVDVFPKKGKTSGAFCIHINQKNPIYVLLNFNGRADYTRVIAHEFGHALHSFYSERHQNALQVDYPTSTAECASTFFEDFALDELKKEVPEEAKVPMIMQKLGEDVSTVFRQIAFYNFESEIHKEKREKGYLSSEQIGVIFRKHMESYMGDFVEQSAGSENYWVYVSHFRRPFYVYSYAFGALISKALQRRVKQDPGFIKEIKRFLSTGGSDSPENIFKSLGIDITKRAIWEEGIQEIRDMLEEV